jgi:photosynthetic reaction center H subunit
LQFCLRMYDPDEIPIDAPDDVSVLRPVPDLGGLPVEDASGITVGRLFGSLIEADTGLVRYVDLDLATLDRHVLVPIGHTRVHEKHSEPRLRLRAALLEELERIPPFAADVGAIDDPFERALLEAYGRTFHGERYYAHPSYDHSGVYAGEHPVVHDDDGSAAGPLMRLSYLPGWRVARGEPDIRGWPVRLGDGTRHRVEDLLVDPAGSAVRYIVASDGADTAYLLPVGFLRIDDAAREVGAAALQHDDVAALPGYDGGGVTREQEDRLHTALRRVFGGRRRYQLPDFDPARHDGFVQQADRSGA